MNTDWFYMAGGNVGGPLPLDSIKAAVLSGRLAGDVVVSHNQTGPWAPLGPVQTPQQRASAQSRHHKRSVSGFIEVIGMIMVFCGVLGIFWACFVSVNGSYFAFPAVISSTSGVVSGLLFLAVAEALRKLGQIAETVEQRAAE